MVFWKIYPILNVIQSIFNHKIFRSQIFDRDIIKSPTGLDAIVIRPNHTNHIISEIRQFIKNNFGSPPTSPILDIPESQLLQENDHIVIVRDINGRIVGCIRYHYIGVFVSSDKKEEIYCVDCFTIINSWRGRGLGDYLLTYLHNYVNEHNIPYSMFLKEGRNLSIVHAPLYTGIYVFRELQLTKSNNIMDITPALAYKLMDISSELNQILIIRNINSTNQRWKLYEKGVYKVLVCFQDAYQSFEAKRPEANNKMKKICWATGWIESPNMTDEYREEASRELSDSMYPEFDYVWMNKEWIGRYSDQWKIDGPFHWYSYQWTSSINIQKSYCILA